MNTFIFNLNDTTALNDSVVAKIVKLSEACQPVVTDTPTNSEDVMIAKIVCTAIVIIAIASLFAFYLWKRMEIIAKKDERNDKRACEEKDRDFKKKANEENRRIQLEDEERKRKSDLLDKYITLIKEQNEEGINEANNYRETLACLIELTQKGVLKEITKDTLNSIFEKNCDEEESK